MTRQWTRGKKGAVGVLAAVLLMAVCILLYWKNPRVQAFRVASWLPLLLCWLLFYILQLSFVMCGLAAVMNIFVGGYGIAGWVALFLLAAVLMGLCYLLGNVLQAVHYVHPFGAVRPFVLERALWWN